MDAKHPTFLNPAKTHTASHAFEPTALWLDVFLGVGGQCYFPSSFYHPFLVAYINALVTMANLGINEKEERVFIRQTRC